MRNLKLTIEYDGTDFYGWQIQETNKRTVQGELEKALLQIFKKHSPLIGSGRTDRGVHAVGQIANFKTKSTLPPIQILKALNANLPADIAVLKVEDVPSNFHAQFSAKSKVYRYAILNRHARSALLRNNTFFFPFSLKLSLMRSESACLIGKKDFKSFRASDPAQKKIPNSDEKSCVRTIKSLMISRSKDFIFIEIEANGFLYKMVRNIVGTLLEIATGQRAAGDLKKVLKQRNRKYAGKTAPAHGLCLMEVKY